MYSIKENISLKQYNTFNVDVSARYFLIINSTAELQQFYNNDGGRFNKKFILGGGSNILFSGDYDGVILKIDIKGIELIDEPDNHYLVKVNAGEDWDSFVEYSLQNNWYGLENLSHIPGTVGAAPVQNIGAYGAEVCSFIESVECFFPEENIIRTLTNAECRFEYRNSIFKNELKNRTIILSVVFKLLKNPSCNISYSGISEELGGTDINSMNIRNAIVSIRKRKLPDPHDLGNAGSFFKNPFIEKQYAEELKKKISDLPLYNEEGMKVKISAAYLIEQCGWKGYRTGDAGVHVNHPLILVNHGNATGKDILELSEKICRSVYERFKVRLEPEVNIV